MLQATMPRPHPSNHSAFRIRDRVAPELHSPKQNQLLAALPSEPYQRLLPHLDYVPLPRGLQLHRSSERETHIYFLTSGLVSRCVETGDGQTLGVSLTGNEGAVGLSLFLGGGGSPNCATVVIPGDAYRLEADCLNAELRGAGSLLRVLMRSALAIIVQSAQTVACTRHHSILQRLCRTLLSCSDKLDSNHIAISQEVLGDMLGVRREGITTAAGSLRNLGLISYERGNIVVEDRPGLEAQTCECYGVVKREYARLLPEPRESDHSYRTQRAA